MCRAKIHDSRSTIGNHNQTLSMNVPLLNTSYSSITATWHSHASFTCAHCFYTSVGRKTCVISQHTLPLLFRTRAKLSQTLVIDRNRYANAMRLKSLFHRCQRSWRCLLLYARSRDYRPLIGAAHSPLELLRYISPVRPVRCVPRGRKLVSLISYGWSIADFGFE